MHYHLLNPLLQMGYASPTQIGKGIHLRQFSRAFVIGDEYGHRVVFVNADICMGTQIVKMQVHLAFPRQISSCDSWYCVTGGREAAESVWEAVHS